jgi:hypothetical protein
VKVFISWSGESSRSIARALDSWLESVVQHVDAWMSDEEIKSGDRWSNEIAKSLDDTNFGVICVTKSNQHAPWLIFEAGALAKSLEMGRVVPLCIDIAPSDVTGPLAAFQGRCLDKDGLRRLVRDIDGACEKPMGDRIDRLFDRMWPDVEAALSDATQQIPGERPIQRSTEDMVAELVERMRRVERNIEGLPFKSVVRRQGGSEDNQGTLPAGAREERLRADPVGMDDAGEH